MAVIRQDIEIDKGGVFNPLFTWKYDNGNPIDLTNYSGRMVIREGRDRESPIIWDGNTDNGKLVILGESGQFRPIISSEETDGFSFDWAYFDIKLLSNIAGGDRYMVGGNVKLNKTVV